MRTEDQETREGNDNGGRGGKTGEDRGSGEKQADGRLGVKLIVSGMAIATPYHAMVEALPMR